MYTFATSMWFLLCFLLPLSAWQTEGLYRAEPHLAIHFVALYLPYNPLIVSLSDETDDEKKCKKEWPECSFVRAEPLEMHTNLPCDLLWVNAKGSELHFLEQNIPLIDQAKVIYTSTHFYHQGAYAQKLKELLRIRGFRLVLHWYEENRQGTALFVKEAILDGELGRLLPPAYLFSVPTEPLGVERYVKPIYNKTLSGNIEGVDFTYMINLDERPEKFERAVAELRFYGIDPFRFSAVNGWKLPVATINAIGLQFTPEMIVPNMMGCNFVAISDTTYRSNEFVQANGKTYYPCGMGQGAVGIVLSHLSVLQDAYNSGYPTIWVMEDDVEAIENPCQLTELIHELDCLVPDWDILFTDTDTKDSEGNHVPCRALPPRPNMNLPPLSLFLDRFIAISDNLKRIGMRYGTYSMIVRRSGIEKILNYYRKYRVFIPYDMDFWLDTTIKMYAPRKDIVSHRAHSLSDNSFAPGYEHATD